MKLWLPDNGVESLENEELIKISYALSAVKREERVVPQGHILISDAQCALPYSLKKQIFPRYHVKSRATLSKKPIYFRTFSGTQTCPAMTWTSDRWSLVKWKKGKREAEKTKEKCRQRSGIGQNWGWKLLTSISLLRGVSGCHVAGCPPSVNIKRCRWNKGLESITSPVVVQ